MFQTVVSLSCSPPGSALSELLELLDVSALGATGSQHNSWLWRPKMPASNASNPKCNMGLSENWRFFIRAPNVNGHLGKIMIIKIMLPNFHPFKWNLNTHWGTQLWSHFQLFYGQQSDDPERSTTELAGAWHFHKHLYTEYIIILNHIYEPIYGKSWESWERFLVCSRGRKLQMIETTFLLETKHPTLGSPDPSSRWTW